MIAVRRCSEHRGQPLAQLTVYSRFRYAPMALTLAGQQMPSLLTRDDFRRGRAAPGVPELIGVSSVFFKFSPVLSVP
jgi:hypothetical protein